LLNFAIHFIFSAIFLSCLLP